MRDHYFIDEDGSRIPVSQMLKSDILDMLTACDIEIIADDEGEGTVADIVERLRIELLIRELGL